MPRWGGGQAATDNNGGVTSTEKAEPPGLLSNGMDSQEIVEEAAEDEAADTKLADDNKGIHYAGIQWKGKTAHAVELEMEALGDRTVMSYAPDAVYLASRLEGLKRNLDVGGDRLKRWAWEDYEDEVAEEGSEDAVREEADTKEELVMPALEQQVADSTMSSLSVSEGITPSDEAMEDPMQATSAVNAEDAEEAMQDGGDIPRITVDASAKAAALDARVEIRTLRRPDLEQVRELHCYHGASEKVSTGRQVRAVLPVRPPFSRWGEEREAVSTFFPCSFSSFLSKGSVPSRDRLSFPFLGVAARGGDGNEDRDDCHSSQLAQPVTLCYPPWQHMLVRPLQTVHPTSTCASTSQLQHRLYQHITT